MDGWLGRLSRVLSRVLGGGGGVRVGEVRLG